MRTGVWGLGAVGLVAAALVAAVLTRTVPVPNRSSDPATPTTARPASAPAAQATLYCEFYNFVGRTPKVGFYFALPASGTSDYAQIFQREIDGAQTDFGGDGQPRPAWAFENSENPAVLTSPDGAIRINLYGYDPAKAGPAWIEAGLRSIQYLNLDGKCRRSGAA